MPDDQLRRTLEQLLERIERIERRLDLTTPEPDEAPAASPTQTPTSTPTLTPSSTPHLPLVTRLTRAKAAADEASAAVPPVAPPTAPPVTPPVTLPVPPLVTPPPSLHHPVAPAAAARTDSERPDQRDGASAMEVLIGAKWAAWVGAIVIVFATGLLIKLGIDEGLWGRLSELTRCLLIAGFGVVLLALGELAMRRISRPASVGLFGAGLGVLYLNAWATSEFFQLLDRGWSFALMAVVAAFGFLVTLRTKFLTIGVLALVGGYLSPILVQRLGGHDIEVAAFLTGLFATSLVLSGVSPRPFRPLRYVALGGQCIVAFFWIVSSGAAVWLMGVVFLSLWWSMLLIEVTAGALRRQSPLGGPIAILVATAGFVTAVCLLLGGAAPAGDAWRGLFTVAIAALGAATALQFGPGLESLRAKPRNAMEKLAVALWSQSGVLLVVAIALQFDDFALTVGWLVIALAAVEVGRRLPSRGVNVFGLIVWALAMSYAWLLRLVMFFGATTGLSGKIVRTSWLLFDEWTLLMIIAVAVTHLMAHRLRGKTPDRSRVMPAILAAIGTASWFGLCLAQCTPLAATTACLVGVVALLALAPLGRRQGYLEIALVALFVTGLKWLLVDGLADRFDPRWQADARAVLLNGQMGLSLAIAATGIWASRIMYRRSAAARIDEAAPRRETWIMPILGSVLLVLAGLTFEIDRAVGAIGPAQLETIAIPIPLLRILWWTALWTMGGLLLVVGSRPAPLRRLRDFGWVILVLGAVAWLLCAVIWRATEGPLAVPVILNLQFGVGALLAIAISIAVRWGRRTNEVRGIDAPAPFDPNPIGFALLGVIGLWLGSLEIDRALATELMAKQAGLSVFWALYGVTLVIVGFIWRSTAARYAGLFLLAIAVLKVVFVDLATIRQVWRVISFLVSGLLLVGTSVLYTKLSPRLLADRAAPRSPRNPP